MPTPKSPRKPDLTRKLRQLERKYAAMGQDMTSYLEGLLHADYLTYWDYVHLETLLSLQNPRTAYPDELIFITYHQTTELYLKLALHEMAQIADHPALDAEFFTARLVRLNRYFELLERSFAVMTEGMEKEQFLKFRMALLPSSGFQSVQFRMVELAATDIANLVAKHEDAPDAAASLDQLPFSKPGEALLGTTAEQSVARQYEKLYWKRGATELATHQKTLTLRQFDKRYGPALIRFADEYRTKNLNQRYVQLAARNATSDDLIAQLREFDWRVNVRWKLAHLRAAVTYLQKEPDDIRATGGTNWQTYLPPRQQQSIFFPGLWSAAEHQAWGGPFMQVDK